MDDTAAVSITGSGDGRQRAGIVIDWAQADPTLALEIRALDDSVKLQKSLRLSEAAAKVIRDE
jgi:hypothetical protein